MTLRLRYAARSHVGHVREGNEDSAYAGSRLALVADGMGGHAAGEVASSSVVSTLAHLDEDETGQGLLEALAGAVRAANERLRRMVEENESLDGMGTTLTAMLASGGKLGLVHVGDSRAYMLRDGELTQVTHDQTLVQRLVDEGRLTPEQAESHPQRSLLTQALDGRPGVEPDLSLRELRKGDRYLLCTDGLSGVVHPETMTEALSLPTGEEAADRLVELALRGGGPDNVTVVVVDVVDDEAGLSDTPVVAGAAADTDAVPGADRVATAGTVSSAASRARRLLPGRRKERAEPSGAGTPDDAVATGSWPPPPGAEPPPPPTAPPAAPETAPAAAVPPAAHATQPAPVEVEAAPAARGRRARGRRRSRGRRLTSVLLLLVAALVIALGAVWAIVRGSWYVGVDAGEVALFRGIKAEPLGISLDEVDTRSGVRVDALDPVEAEAVRGGIPVDDRDDGLARLCAFVGPAPSSPVPPVPTGAPTPTGRPDGGFAPTPEAAVVGASGAAAGAAAAAGDGTPSAGFDPAGQAGPTAGAAAEAGPRDLAPQPGSDGTATGATPVPTPGPAGPRDPAPAGVVGLDCPAGP